MGEDLTGRAADARERDRTQDRRDREADDREGALTTRESQVEAQGAQVEAREAQVEARETSRAERLEEARGVRADADERDADAADRDWDAATRDLAANVAATLRRDDEGGKALAVRQAGQRDRKDAKADRMSSAMDRALLSEDDDPRDGNAMEAPGH